MTIIYKYRISNSHAFEYDTSKELDTLLRVARNLEIGASFKNNGQFIFKLNDTSSLDNKPSSCSSIDVVIAAIEAEGFTVENKPLVFTRLKQ